MSAIVWLVSGYAGVFILFSIVIANILQM